MLNIKVCDDSTLHLEEMAGLLKEALADVPYDLTLFRDQAHCLASFGQQELSTIVLLDIEFGAGQANGIALARQILERAPHAQIIFVSAYLQYALDIDEVDHIYFLMKPVSREKLHRALTKAQDRLYSLPIAFQLHGRSHILLQSEIMFLERVQHYTSVYYGDQTLRIARKLDSILPELDKRRFFRCHQSFIANWEYVSSVSMHTLLLRSGHTVPISRKFYKQVKEQYARYIGGIL